MSHTLDRLNSGNCDTQEMRDALRRAMAEVIAGIPEYVVDEQESRGDEPATMEDAIRFAIADVVCSGPERILRDLDRQQAGA